MPFTGYSVGLWRGDADPGGGMFNLLLLVASSLAPMPRGSDCWTGRRSVVLGTSASLLLPRQAMAADFLEKRFSLTLPSDYVVSKRSATQGTIFVAGNFPRASTISVTAW